jgi:hypothetical protein
MRLGSHRWRTTRLLAGIVLAAVMSAGTVDEYQVKAAFLYNFAKFVEWPAEAFRSDKDPLRICVLGANPFGSSLSDVLRGKTVLGRPIALADITDPAQAADCQIVFINESERKRVRLILKTLPRTGILTVSESEGFAAHGGIVNFTRDGGHLGFEINAGVASDARLRISSRVLQLAHIVKSGSLD